MIPKIPCLLNRKKIIIWALIGTQKRLFVKIHKQCYLSSHKIVKKKKDLLENSLSIELSERIKEMSTKDPNKLQNFCNFQDFYNNLEKQPILKINFQSYMIKRLLCYHISQSLTNYTYLQIMKTRKISIKIKEDTINRLVVKDKTINVVTLQKRCISLYLVSVQHHRQTIFHQVQLDLRSQYLFIKI